MHMPCDVDDRGNPCCRPMFTCNLATYLHQPGHNNCPFAFWPFAAYNLLHSPARSPPLASRTRKQKHALRGAEPSKVTLQ